MTYLRNKYINLYQNSRLNTQYTINIPRNSRPFRRNLCFEGGCNAKWSVGADREKLGLGYKGGVYWWTRYDFISI